MTADQPKQPSVGEYLESFRVRHPFTELAERVESLRKLKVLVIGDIIIDEYDYCRAIGKSSKSATLTARYLSSERQAGGVLAVANHLAGFVDRVDLVALRGMPDADEDFISAGLRPNVRSKLVRDASRPTVVKRRFVEPFQLGKMFELIWLEEEPPGPDVESRLIAAIEEKVVACDLVLVADFGHGGVTPGMVELVTGRAEFLAVNAQTNSANFGYNMVTRFPRADYICIDEEELRLAAQSRRGDLIPLVADIADRLGCGMATVTQGTRGSLTWSATGVSVQTPVLSSELVDSVGAGDAYLSLSSLCVRAGFDPELVGFLGNCAGNLAVRYVGNQDYIDSGKLIEFIQSLV